MPPSTEEIEPNDDITTATLITEGTTVRGSLATNQDRDFFKFNASSQKTRVILRKQFFAAVDVYDQVEKIVAKADALGDTTITLSFESTPNSIYYILVKPGPSPVPAFQKLYGDYELVVRKE